MKIGGVVLALSLGANGWMAIELARARGRGATAPPAAPVSDEHAAPPPDRPSFWPERRGPSREARASSLPAAPAGDAATLAALAEVGAAEQRAARCEVAEREQAERWAHDRDKTVASLRLSLADAAKQSEDAAREAKKLADLVGLDRDDGARLAEGYAPLRLQRMAAARAALEHDPPDWDAVMAAARGLFSDEDSLAARFGGEAGRQAVRADYLDGRSTIMALIAALAGSRCDDASCAW